MLMTFNHREEESKGKNNINPFKLSVIINIARIQPHTIY